MNDTESTILANARRCTDFEKQLKALAERVKAAGVTNVVVTAHTVDHFEDWSDGEIQFLMEIAVDLKRHGSTDLACFACGRQWQAGVRFPALALHVEFFIPGGQMAGLVCDDCNTPSKVGAALNERFPGHDFKPTPSGGTARN